MFQCLECGKKFPTESAAWRASLDGCPGCNGTDIDLAVNPDDASEDNTDEEIDGLGDDPRPDRPTAA